MAAPSPDEPPSAVSPGGFASSPPQLSRGPSLSNFKRRLATKRTASPTNAPAVTFDTFGPPPPPGLARRVSSAVSTASSTGASSSASEPLSPHSPRDYGGGGCLMGLIGNLRTGSGRGRRDAAVAIGELAAASPATRRELVESGGLHSLLQLFTLAGASDWSETESAAAASIATIIPATSPLDAKPLMRQAHTILAALRLLLLQATGCDVTMCGSGGGGGGASPKPPPSETADSHGAYRPPAPSSARSHRLSLPRRHPLLRP